MVILYVNAQYCPRSTHFRKKKGKSLSQEQKRYELRVPNVRKAFWYISLPCFSWQRREHAMSQYGLVLPIPIMCYSQGSSIMFNLRCRKYHPLTRGWIFKLLCIPFKTILIPVKLYIFMAKRFGVILTWLVSIEVLNSKEEQSTF